SLIPDEIVQKLVDSMPTHRGPDLQEDRELPKYDYVRFMETFIGGGRSPERQQTNGAQQY
ncbi:hypothetical protein KC343_g16630, partial [Hortaea werneckii]